MEYSKIDPDDPHHHDYCIMFTDDEMDILSEHGLKYKDSIFTWLLERTDRPSWATLFRQHSYPMYVKLDDDENIMDFMVEFKMMWL